MRKILFAFIALSFFAPAFSQDKQPIKVLLLGVFHFDNPGLDVAKFKNADILSAQRQKEVMEVVNKLKAFAPDKIFIEAAPENQQKIDSQIMQYKAGKFTLGANEIQQLGYRLAKDLNLPTLYGVDYRDADFPFDSLMKSANEAGQTSLLSFVQKMIDSVQTAFNEHIQKSTVSEMLIWQNSAQSNFSGVDFYFRLLPAGKPGNHIGSYLTSEWWRRNMIIYENILKNLNGSEKKIVVIFGSGHTALLNEMMKFNPAIQLVGVEGVLR
ncbi:MAG TPA: DUF5694 domain-containing protein [Puia sp.]|nr:DUF5694 domain-containing protein [Puia sp.]